METTVATIFEGYREVHQQFRTELETLTLSLLHAVPAPETNSIAILIHHTLGSEAQVVRLLAGVPAPRDREAEFRITAADIDMARLQAELDDADRLLEEMTPHISTERLQMLLERPGRSPHTGLTWLVNNYGHAREHLAHLQLTRQILSSAPRP